MSLGSREGKKEYVSPIQGQAAKQGGRLYAEDYEEIKEDSSRPFSKRSCMSV